jgi:hypothetical protein
MVVVMMMMMMMMMTTTTTTATVSLPLRMSSQFSLRKHLV